MGFNFKESFWASPQFFAVLIGFSVFFFGARIIFLQEQSLTGEVITITHDSFPWDMTTVEVKTYSGSSTSISFEGHITLKIGLTYKFTTKGTWYRQGTPTLISLELISSSEA